MKTKYGNATINTSGHYQISTTKEGNHNRLLHRLIWEDFYDKSIPKDYVIHHINDCKTDNRIQNLQCVKDSIHKSHHVKSNMNNVPKSKEHKQALKDNHADFNGVNNPNAELTVKDVKLIKRMLRTGNVKINRIADWFPVSVSAINNIKYGNTWTHINILDN
jgi:hypothetical protein